MQLNLSEDRKYCVYTHSTLDRGENNYVFYVGMGVYPSRPYSKSGRNYLWKATVNRLGVKVDVVFKDLTKEEAFEKERDLIAKYRLIGQCSCNIEDGGKSKFYKNNADLLK